MKQEVIKIEDKSLIKATAILSLTILEAVALVQGLDGAYFLPVVALIAGLAGYEAGKRT